MDIPALYLVLNSSIVSASTTVNIYFSSIVCSDRTTSANGRLPVRENEQSLRKMVLVVGRWGRSQAKAKIDELDICPACLSNVMMVGFGP